MWSVLEVIGRRWNAFHDGLRRGDPPASVESLRVTLKPGVRPVNARPRVYNPIKTTWSAACMALSAALGLVSIFRPCGPVQLWLRQQKGGVGVVSDFWAANQQVENVPGVMTNQEASMAKLSEDRIYVSLDFLQGCWQCPLAPDAQEIFTIAALDGLCTPTSVPQGILNTTCYIQATLTRVLEVGVGRD